jgi:hypothetical protein
VHSTKGNSVSNPVSILQMNDLELLHILQTDDETMASAASIAGGWPITSMSRARRDPPTAGSRGSSADGGSSRIEHAQGGALARLADDLPSFSPARHRTEPPSAASVAEALMCGIRPDELTPRAALDLLYRLKALVTD